MSEQTGILARYAAASRRCRAIADRIGVHRCDGDPQWLRAERAANAAYAAARAAGHSAPVVLRAGRSA